VHLALQAQLVDMLRNDLQYMLPDDNGRRVCEMALASFSHATVHLCEQFESVLATMPEPAPDSAAASSSPTASNSTSNSSDDKEKEKEASHAKMVRRCRKAAAEFSDSVPEAVRGRVLELAGALSACNENVQDLPPYLDLSSTKASQASTDAPETKERPPPPATPTTDPTPIEDNERAAAAAALSTTNKKILDKSDPANMQFCDHWCWEVEDNAADPGQTVTLRKYDPIDVLQVSE
jgi:hypothetical protein